MNKKEFISWIESLPEDFEVFPISASEITEESSPWVSDYETTGTTFQSVYKKNVRTNMKLDVTFEGEVSGEFKRDQFGVEHWANVRRVK
jgi:hypothetical protein